MESIQNFKERHFNGFAGVQASPSIIDLIECVGFDAALLVHTKEQASDPNWNIESKEIKILEIGGLNVETGLYTVKYEIEGESKVSAMSASGLSVISDTEFTQIIPLAMRINLATRSTLVSKVIDQFNSEDPGLTLTELSDFRTEAGKPIDKFICLMVVIDGQCVFQASRVVGGIKVGDAFTISVQDEGGRSTVSLSQVEGDNKITARLGKDEIGTAKVFLLGK